MPRPGGMRGPRGGPGGMRGRGPMGRGPGGPPPGPPGGMRGFTPWGPRWGQRGPGDPPPPPPPRPWGRPWRRPPMGYGRGGCMGCAVAVLGAVGAAALLIAGLFALL